MEDYNLAVTISVQNADRPFICTYFLLELINSLILCCIRIKYNIYNNYFFVYCIDINLVYIHKIK